MIRCPACVRPDSLSTRQWVIYGWQADCHDCQRNYEELLTINIVEDKVFTPVLTKIFRCVLQITVRMNSNVLNPAILWGMKEVFVYEQTFRQQSFYVLKGKLFLQFFGWKKKSNFRVGLERSVKPVELWLKPPEKTLVNFSIREIVKTAVTPVTLLIRYRCGLWPGRTKPEVFCGWWRRRLFSPEVQRRQCWRDSSATMDQHREKPKVRLQHKVNSAVRAPRVSRELMKVCPLCCRSKSSNEGR